MCIHSLSFCKIKFNLKQKKKIKKEKTFLTFFTFFSFIYIQFLVNLIFLNNFFYNEKL